MAEDNWVKSALSDDSLAAELLLRLRQSSIDSYSQSWLPNRLPKPRVLPPLGWGHRQRRSKLLIAKDREPTRCSPTTPLSWSAASLSDVNDESIAGRSKGTFAYESTTASAKKSRKKKTYAELKEEESFLLKERIHLKRELASVHLSLDEQRSRSDNFKRIKLDLHLQCLNKTGATSNEPVAPTFNKCYQKEAPKVDQAHVILPRHTKSDDLGPLYCCRVQKNSDGQERCFVVPDLNMTPLDEDLVCEIFYGMS